MIIAVLLWSIIGSFYDCVNGATTTLYEYDLNDATASTAYCILRATRNTIVLISTTAGISYMCVGRTVTLDTLKVRWTQTTRKYTM
jgi:hypothetical protein